jgi:Short-chain dehydrogenase involved in D-alanine esterification of lipoteichoic acid and wall teichoic acid (D-alanine transfer protein)
LLFSYKIVCVTGGTSGIGLGIAKHYLAEGATVIISGRITKKLDESKQALFHLSLYAICWDITAYEVADAVMLPLVVCRWRIWPLRH